MNHFYRDVPGLGNVAVARHAQNRMAQEGVPPDAFERALLHPTKPDVADGMDVLWREREGLRIVILTNPTPNREVQSSLRRFTGSSSKRRRARCG